MRARPGFRSFTVIRHTAPACQCRIVRSVLPNHTPELRQGFERTMQMNLPNPAKAGDLSMTDRQTMLMAWLRFAKLVLGGQTGLKVHALWRLRRRRCRGSPAPAAASRPTTSCGKEGLERGLAYLSTETAETARPCQPTLQAMRACSHPSSPTNWPKPRAMPTSATCGVRLRAWQA